MHLSNIKLWNFRKFGTGALFSLEKPHLDLGLNAGLNVLIGENDSGKSAIIDAIRLVLKTHSYDWARIGEDDFHHAQCRMRIELILSGLGPPEAKNFTEFLCWEPGVSAPRPYLRLILEAKKNALTGQVMPYEVRAGADAEGKTLSPEAKEYLKVTYLKPLRDAEEELVARKNSRLSQILVGHEAFKNKGIRQAQAHRVLRHDEGAGDSHVRVNRPDTARQRRDSSRSEKQVQSHRVGNTEGRRKSKTL